MENMNESYEDYLKAIYQIARSNTGGWVSNREIAEYLEVRPSSVTEMLYKLKRADLIKWQPRKSIRLTAKGKNIAETLLETYHSLYEFFSDVLKISDEGLLEEICCKIEHHLTPEITHALDNLLVKYQ